MSKQTNQVSLTDLMSALMAFEAPTPCFLFTRVVPDFNKFGRTKDVQEGVYASGPTKGQPKFRGRDNPYIHYDQMDEKGEPKSKIVKFTKQFVRVNDSYEGAVIRRQLTEAAHRGESIKAEDLFVADKATWGALVDKDTPPLFNWWVPKYTTEIQFYMAYRPVQHKETWYQWEEDIDGHKKGEKLTPEETKVMKTEYMPERDDEMTAMRQEVDKIVAWRKVRFDGIIEMTIGGDNYEVTDRTMPEVPQKQREHLMKMVADRDERKAMEERVKLEEKARKQASKQEVRKMVGEENVVQKKKSAN